MSPQRYENMVCVCMCACVWDSLKVPRPHNLTTSDILLCCSGKCRVCILLHTHTHSVLSRDTHPRCKCLYVCVCDAVWSAWSQEKFVHCTCCAKMKAPFSYNIKITVTSVVCIKWKQYSSIYWGKKSRKISALKLLLQVVVKTRC